MVSYGASRRPVPSECLALIRKPRWASTPTTRCKQKARYRVLVKGQTIGCPNCVQLYTRIEDLEAELASFRGVGAGGMSPEGTGVGEQAVPGEI